MVAKVDELKQRVSNVDQYYTSLSKKQSNLLKGGAIINDLDKERQVIYKKPIDPGEDAKKKKEARAYVPAWPNIVPDFDTPMHFTTIQNKMEAKDGMEYPDVRKICADVRLIFKNAMRYNDKKNEIHVMAKTLLEKFEENGCKYCLESWKRKQEKTKRKQKLLQICS